jgi:DNA repair exonuclease SbcCD ATPase subunit
MKIMATCQHCGRDFQLDQLIEGPVITGKCPWCGELLAPQYTALLPEVIRRAEGGGAELESALRMLAGSWARFRIKPESVLEPLRQELGATEEEHRRREGLRQKLREALSWADRQSPASIESDLAAGNDRIEALERELREVGTAGQARERRASQEVEEAAHELVASADEAGGSGSDVRKDAARLSEGGGEIGNRSAAAADRLSEARERMADAGSSEERVRAALEKVRAALHEAEEALAGQAA